MQKTEELINILETAGFNDDEIGSILTIGVKSNKKIKNAVYQTWINKNEDILNQARERTLEDITSLPYTEVERDGAIYQIHGIVHGGRFLCKPGKKAKELVNKSAESYIKPPLEDYVFEPGFNNIFKLDPEKEMHNTQMYALNNLTQKDKASFLLNIGAQLVMLPFVKLLGNQADKKLKMDIIKPLEDPRYLPNTREIYFKCIELPQPEDMQIKAYYGNGLDRYVIHYSASMAAHMISTAEENNLKKLYAIVGMGHESQIANFVKHAKIERC